MPPRFGGPGGYAAGGGYGAYGRRRGQDGTVLSVALLLAQQAATLERKPPVTLLLAAVQVLFFLRPEGLDWVPSVRSGCLLPAKMFGRWWAPEWGRFLWAPWLHADEMHLFYNMSSFLWKGSQLEPRLGSLGFLRLVAELALTSNALYCAGALLLARHAPLLGRPLMRTCAVGFSGVLFGLKVVLNHNSPGWSEVLGIHLPTKYVCWAELVYLQLLVPNASFMGHLCGILAGLLYVAATRRLPFLPGSTAGGGRGGRSRGGGGGGGRGRAQAGRASSWGALLGRLLGVGGRRRPRTYGHGTWGSGAGAGAGAGGGAGFAAGPHGSGQRW